MFSSRTMWDSFQTSVFNVESLPLIVSRMLHAHAGHACMLTHHGCACRLIPVCACRGLPWPYFYKKIYLLIKIYIFHFNISQVNLTSDWALKQPWILEFQHQWGRGAWVVRGTKCGVYRCLSFDSWASLTESKE